MNAWAIFGHELGKRSVQSGMLSPPDTAKKDLALPCAPIMIVINCAMRFATLLDRCRDILDRLNGAHNIGPMVGELPSAANLPKYDGRNGGI